LHILLHLLTKKRTISASSWEADQLETNDVMYDYNTDMCDK